MSYSPKQWRAINHYLTKNDLKPELSLFPVIRATNKKTGEIVEMHISNIEDFHTADKLRAKAQLKAEKQRNKVNN
jgi:hypothetical protein